ncbi:MAG: L-threonylcarbamoyladenylate synthase [Gaiellales bacterium]|nr:L-threonylcarbamoyladenylate synthase [Gaiellales bacterium]
MGIVELAVPAGAEQRLRDGELAILPTDTVYGIACAAGLPESCARLYRLKQRPAEQPTAIMLGSVEQLLRELPELPDAAAVICRKLLPGPVTLIVPNPGRRFEHLCGCDHDRIGVRVPTLDPPLAALADAVGGLMITSANLRGAPAPAGFDQVPRELREACGFALDGGVLPGTASAVIDVTTPDPSVLRPGPGLDQALEVLR